MIKQETANQLLALVIKEKVRSVLNPVFQGLGEAVKGIKEVPLGEQAVTRLDLLNMVALATGEIVSEQKERLINAANSQRALLDKH